MWQRWARRSSALSADDSLRCVIVRGAGEKAFSPGNDIGEFATERANKAQAIDYGSVMHRTAEALADCRHPLVAQIHGICVGGGLEIAALCDLRICGESSRFGAPIKNLGLVMAYAEMAPLVRLVGPAVALEILLEGRIFDARRSEGQGARHARRARRPGRGRSARDAQSASPTARRWSRAGTRSSRAGWPTARPLTAAEHDECFDCFDTEDFRIGYAAFLAKQKPEFVGERMSSVVQPARSPACACSSSRRSWPGPTCGMMLADMGADVIKVEKLPGGDDARGYREPRVNGVSAPFLMLNRNKRGIALESEARRRAARSCCGWSATPTC